MRGKFGEMRWQSAEPLKSVAWHHEGKHFVSSHTDGSLCTWPLRPSPKPQIHSFPHGKLNVLCYVMSNFLSSRMVSGNYMGLRAGFMNTRTMRPRRFISKVYCIANIWKDVVFIALRQYPILPLIFDVCTLMVN